MNMFSPNHKLNTLCDTIKVTRAIKKIIMSDSLAIDDLRQTALLVEGIKKRSRTPPKEEKEILDNIAIGINELISIMKGDNDSFKPEKIRANIIFCLNKMIRLKKNRLIEKLRDE